MSSGGFAGFTRPQTTRASRFLMCYNAMTGIFGLLFVFASFYARSRVPTVRSLTRRAAPGEN